MRRPTRIYEEDETIDLACQEGRCRHRWHENPECDDVFADHDSHNGDRTAERALRPGNVRASERIANAEYAREDRMADFVQRVLNNDTSESDDDLPPQVVTCSKPNCDCVAHSNNSVFASEQGTDNSFEATPTMLSQASKSADTSASGTDFVKFTQLICKRQSIDMSLLSEIEERKELERKREEEFQRYLREGSDSSLDDFDIPGRVYKKRKLSKTCADSKVSTGGQANDKRKVSDVGDRRNTKSHDWKAVDKKQSSFDSRSSNKPATGVSKDNSIGVAGPSCGKKNSLGSKSGKVWKGKGEGKTSAKAEAAAKLRASKTTTAKQASSTTGNGAQGATSSDVVDVDMKIWTQLDGINDDASSSSSESLASTFVMSEASMSLLENRNASQVSCDGHSHDSESLGSSRAQERYYNPQVLDDEIFQVVPIAPGWPTMAEATGSLPHKETEPLMRPDFNDPNMRVSDGSMATTSEYSESSIDGEEEVVF